MAKQIKLGCLCRGIIVVFAALTLFLPLVSAHCPLCTVSTIIGVGVTRTWGLDDSLVGVFVGGMIASSALWINNVLTRRGLKGNDYLRGASLIVAMFVLTIWTFSLAGLFGVANTYRIFGMEKITFGAISGTIVSFVAFFASKEIKRRNKGKVLFSHQTMTLTFGALILNGLLFWMVFK